MARYDAASTATPASKTTILRGTNREAPEGDPRSCQRRPSYRNSRAFPDHAGSLSAA